MLSLCCEIRCQHSQRLEITGGASDSIFPEVEEWLEKDDHIKCIKYFGEPSKRFRSLMDFLVCVVFPEQLEPCFAYYKNQGPQLVDMVNKIERSDMVDELLNTLEECWISFCQKTPYYYIPMVYEPRQKDSYFATVSAMA